MDSFDSAESNEISGLVLVVDDDQSSRLTHRAILAKQFDVITANSGKEALDICRERQPDLILLDIAMPEIDGIETCRQLRNWTNIPIIFATGHDSLEEHLKAYDAGGNDLIPKPVRSEILLRKVSMAIRQFRAEANLVEEKSSLQKMAMSFLSTVGQNGALLNFMRTSVACRNHRDLAKRLYETSNDLGVQCSVMIRHDNGPTVITPRGDPTPIEQAILEQSSGMGRIFQFKSRLVVNYDRVSIIVSNMPAEDEDAEQAGRIRDNIAILAETAEALCDNVDMRLESMRRAEQLQIALGGGVAAVEGLRERHLLMLRDASILLQTLTDQVERNYAWLDPSRDQEIKITREMEQSVQNILALLAKGGDFDQQFGDVLATLRGGSLENFLELF